MSGMLDDIKTVLGFYKALGIERIPFEISAPAENPTVKKGGHTAKVKAGALGALKEEIGGCTGCKLSSGRKNIVFGEGNPDASLMFIGEGPGKEEDIEARPFVGEAGQLLTKLIAKMGFKREDVYIGNIVKCRPPGNRDPEEEEIAACLPFIKRQIEIISPRVIMTLGRISSQTLISTRIPISRLRGRFYAYEGIPVMPTFHPAYLLRNRKDKQLVWEDAIKALEKLGMPLPPLKPGRGPSK